MRAQTKIPLLHVQLPCISSTVLSHPKVGSLQVSTRQPESRRLPHEVSCINKGRKPSLCHVDQHLPSSQFQMCLTNQAAACTSHVRSYQTLPNSRAYQHPVTGLSMLLLNMLRIINMGFADKRITTTMCHITRQQLVIDTEMACDVIVQVINGFLKCIPITRSAKPGITRMQSAYLAWLSALVQPYVGLSSSSKIYSKCV